jgi:hypothetical protein
MRSLATALLAAALLAGCGTGEDHVTRTSGLADLVVRVDDDGAKGARRPAELRLHCATAADSQACGEAAGVSQRDLAPTPGDQACTQVYGGPETASIEGTLRGNRVDARFSRKDGCEIARWKRVQDLLAEVP